MNKNILKAFKSEQYEKRTILEANNTRIPPVNGIEGQLRPQMLLNAVDQQIYAQQTTNTVGKHNYVLDIAPSTTSIQQSDQLKQRNIAYVEKQIYTNTLIVVKLVVYPKCIMLPIISRSITATVYTNHDSIANK